MNVRQLSYNVYIQTYIQRDLHCTVKNGSPWTARSRQQSPPLGSNLYRLIFSLPWVVVNIWLLEEDWLDSMGGSHLKMEASIEWNHGERPLQVSGSVHRDPVCTFCFSFSTSWIFFWEFVFCKISQVLSPRQATVGWSEPRLKISLGRSLSRQLLPPDRVWPGWPSLQKDKTLRSHWLCV